MFNPFFFSFQHYTERDIFDDGPRYRLLTEAELQEKGVTFAEEWKRLPCSPHQKREETWTLNEPLPTADSHLGIHVFKVSLWYPFNVSILAFWVPPNFSILAFWVPPNFSILAFWVPPNFSISTFWLPLNFSILAFWMPPNFNILAFWVPPNLRMPTFWYHPNLSFSHFGCLPDLTSIYLKRMHEVQRLISAGLCLFKVTNGLWITPCFSDF